MPQTCVMCHLHNHPRCICQFRSLIQHPPSQHSMKRFKFRVKGLGLLIHKHIQHTDHCTDKYTLPTLPVVAVAIDQDTLALNALVHMEILPCRVIVNCEGVLKALVQSRYFKSISYYKGMTIRLLAQ